MVPHSKPNKGNVRFSNFSFPEFRSLPVKAVQAKKLSVGRTNKIEIISYSSLGLFVD
jgi:hypothetical protein